MIIKILQGIGAILAGALGCLVYIVIYGIGLALIGLVAFIFLGWLF
jgi:hypothetical protein